MRQIPIVAVAPRERRPAARIAAAIIATSALALPAAACSGSPSSAGASGSPNASPNAAVSTGSPSAVAYSHCMRSHGVPDFPDPGSNGIPKVGPQQLGVSDPQFRAAQTACAHLLQPTQNQARQILTGMLNFARCMRSHGVPNWPDPTTGGNGQPEFDIPGIDPNSPQVSNTAAGCTHLLVQSVTGPATIELCGGVGENGECHGYGRPPGS